MNNITTEQKTASKNMKQGDMSMGDISAHHNRSPVKQGTTEISPHDVRKLSLDTQLRNKHMSALPATLCGFGILALFAGCLALWTIYVPLRSAVSAPAEVVFKGKRQTVQHLEGGIVDKILVRDGDMVQAGQPLLILEDNQVQPIVRMLQQQNMAERAQMARLEAESRGQKNIGSTGREVANKYTLTENRLFKARKETYQNQIELTHIQIAQIKESLRGSQARLMLKDQEIASIREQLAANQDLVKEGYVTRTVILDLQRVLAANSGEREAIIAAIASDKQRIAEFEQRILVLQSDRVQGAVSELKQSALRQIDQEERIRPLRDTLERQIVRAPVTGRVVGLKVTTIGEVIMPREQLMEIAPTGETLLLEAKIDVKDISEVKVGQEADVMITGFDSRKTLPLRARVIYISDDRIAPASSQGQPYYSARLEFEKDASKKLGDHNLIPGMSANVSIVIAPRAALDYLIGPLRESARKALQIK